MVYHYLPALVAAAVVTLLSAAEFATAITLAALTSPRLVLPTSAAPVVAQMDVDVALGRFKVHL